MSDFKFLIITANPSIARYAVDSGASRLFVDLEIRGKEERQGHLSTVISRHGMADVSTVRAAVPGHELMVRLNPWHRESSDEVEEALERGADLLMLPMFSRPEEVGAFCDAVAGRAGVIPLVETPAAIDCIDEVVVVPGVKEVYLGLNDLHLAMGLRFMFQLLVDGTVDHFAEVARKAGLPFGFGGVARAGEGQLPAELIMIEHARLGSTRTILSRSFHRQASAVEEITANMDFPGELERLHQAWFEGLSMGRSELKDNRNLINMLVDRVVDRH